MGMVMLTTAQLAKRLGIAPITLQIWRSQGIGIPFVKQGTQVFYRLTTSDNPGFGLLHLPYVHAEPPL